jgi:hypothetical protein
MASVAAASMLSVAIIRARPPWNSCTPLRSPPAVNASPRTSRLFASTEPMSADFTTSTSPSWSANSAMKSSGRLPSADCTVPALAAPRRAPSCSVAPPTRRASAAIATAATTNCSTAVSVA